MNYSLPFRIHHLALAAALAGCLPADDGYDYVPMCHATADCDPGKTCDEGICWGDPPDRQFAAVLVPPSEGWPELATTEISALSIAPDGWIENLGFAETALIAGRVTLACGVDPDCDPDVSIEAQITFSKPSIIAGRPAYTRTVTSVAGVAGSEPSYTVALPLSDVPYQVHVVPSRGSSATPAGVQPSELAAPVDDEINVTGDATLDWAVGDPLGHKVVLGQVVDAARRGMGGMQVMAVAKSAGAGSTGRSSSIATTDAEGYFTLRIPLGLSSTVMDLVAAPVEPGSAPTLLVSDVDIPDPVDGLPIELPELLQLPITSPVQSFTIPIRGRTSTGDEVPVRGAAVRVVTADFEGLQTGTTAMFSASTFTDDDGNAVLDLLPGHLMKNKLYMVSVEPLPSSEHATLHEHTIEVGLEPGLLASIQLERRVAVSGVVYAADGAPVYQATVAARIAPGFRQALYPQARAVVDNLQLPSATTDISGRFVAWLDPALVGQAAVYDLEITPADPLMPLWTVRDIDMSAGTDAGVLELSDIAVPRASYARGLVFAPDDDDEDDADEVVPQASLRLYEVLDPGTCESCPAAAVFRGLAASQEGGLIWLVLPDSAE